MFNWYLQKMCFRRVFVSAYNFPRFPKENACVERFATAKATANRSFCWERGKKQFSLIVIQVSFRRPFSYERCLHVRVTGLHW